MGTKKSNNIAKPKVSLSGSIACFQVIFGTIFIMEYIIFYVGILVAFIALWKSADNIAESKGSQAFPW